MGSTEPLAIEFKAYSPPYVDRIWSICGSSYNIPKAIWGTQSFKLPLHVFGFPKHTGRYNMEYRILGSRLGLPYFENYHVSSGL